MSGKYCISNVIYQDCCTGGICNFGKKCVCQNGEKLKIAEATNYCVNTKVLEKCIEASKDGVDCVCKVDGNHVNVCGLKHTCINAKCYQKCDSGYNTLNSDCICGADMALTKLAKKGQ